MSKVELGSIRTAVLIGWEPARIPPPLSPHLGSYTRALLVSQYRRLLLVTPCWPVSAVSDGNVVIAQALPARPPLSWLAAAATSYPTTGSRGLRQVSLKTDTKGEMETCEEENDVITFMGGGCKGIIFRTVAGQGPFRYDLKNTRVADDLYSD